MKNSKKQLPWMPFYPEDWLSDMQIILLTMEQEGMLLRLVLLDWTQEGIPSDPASLIKLLRIKPKCFSKNWEEIEQFFHVHPQKPDHLTFRNLLEIKEEQLNKTKSRKQKAKNAADIRWKKKDAPSNAQTLPKQCHTETESETESESEPCLLETTSMGNCSKSSPDKSELPPDWTPRNPEFASENGMDPAAAIEFFRDWAIGEGKTAANWDSKWMNACRDWLPDRVKNTSPTASTENRQSSEIVQEEGKEEAYVAFLKKDYPDGYNRYVETGRKVESFYDEFLKMEDTA
jgi:uncharacterized protein YdaU (DUF1376 family)